MESVWNVPSRGERQGYATFGGERGGVQDSDGELAGQYSLISGDGQNRLRVSGIDPNRLITCRGCESQGVSMWLFTRHGFYSVVSKDIDRVVVRARNRRHLENLQNEFDTKGEIIVGGGTDYPFRMVLSRSRWEFAVAQMTQEIAYTNFKKEAAQRWRKIGVAYVNALHDVWHVMKTALRRGVVS